MVLAGFAHQQNRPIDERRDALGIETRDAINLADTSTRPPAPTRERRHHVWSTRDVASERGIAGNANDDRRIAPDSLDRL